MLNVSLRVEGRPLVALWVSRPHPGGHRDDLIVSHLSLYTAAQPDGTDPLDSRECGVGLLLLLFALPGRERGNGLGERVCSIKSQTPLDKCFKTKPVKAGARSDSPSNCLLLNNNTTRVWVSSAKSSNLTIAIEARWMRRTLLIRPP